MRELSPKEITTVICKTMVVCNEAISDSENPTSEEVRKFFKATLNDIIKEYQLSKDQADAVLGIALGTLREMVGKIAAYEEEILEEDSELH